MERNLILNGHLKKIRRRKSKLGAGRAFGIQVLSPGAKLNENQMFKVFPSASALFILIGLECLRMMPGGSAEAERGAPPRPRWSVDHSRRLPARLSAGGRVQQGVDQSQGTIVGRITPGLGPGVCSVVQLFTVLVLVLVCGHLATGPHPEGRSTRP